MKLSLGYMAFPTKAEAKNIVLGLLEERLIASANILPSAESYFAWDDEIQKSNEVIVIFKTRTKNEDKITKIIRRYHSYEIPCVVFTSINHGNPDFLKWVNDSC